MRILPALSALASSRKAMIALGTIVGVILARFGLSTADAAVITNALLVIGPVLIGAIALEDSSAKFRAGPAATGEVGTGEVPTAQEVPADAVRKDPPGGRLQGLVAAGLLSLLVFGAGCAKSPTARWAQARDALTVAQNTARAANQNGALSNKDFIAIDPFAQAVRGALAEAEKELPDGGKTFDWYMNLAERVLRQLSTPVPPSSKEAQRVRSTTRPVSAGSRGPDSRGGVHVVRRSPGVAAETVWRVHGRAARGDQGAGRRV
jgi:hypothetical protein